MNVREFIDNMTIDVIVSPVHDKSSISCNTVKSALFDKGRDAG